MKYLPLIALFFVVSAAYKCQGPKAATLTANTPGSLENPTTIEELVNHYNIEERYQDEDWWFILKAPQSRKFFYASASLPALQYVDNIALFEEIFVIDHLKSLAANTDAFSFLHEKAKTNTGNEDVYRISQTPPNRFVAADKTRKTLNELNKPQFGNMINVLEIAFNDQEHSNQKTLYIEDEKNKKTAILLKPLQDFIPISEHFGRYGGKTGPTIPDGMYWKAAHSKYIVSIDRQGTSSHILQHSLPRTPVDYYKLTGIQAEKAIINDWTELNFKIIPDADNPDETKVNQAPGANNNEIEIDETDESVINDLTKSIWKLSQHAFCYSFGNTKLKTILRMLLHTYPKIVNINFSPHLLQGADAWDDLRLDILSTIRAQPTEQDREKGVGFLDTRTKCKAFWKSKPNPPDQAQLAPIVQRKTPEQTAHNTAIRHLEYQFKNAEQNRQPVGNNIDAEYFGCSLVHHADNLRLIAHAPFMVQEKNLVPKGQQAPPSEKCSTTYFGPIHWVTVSQILDTSLYLSTWKNADLPAISGSKTVLQLQKFKLAGIEFVHGYGHEKIAFSMHSDSPIVCFGDANHRKSEVTHAGLVFCLRNQELWKVLHDSRIEGILHPNLQVPVNKEAPVQMLGATDQTASFLSSLTDNGKKFLKVPAHVIVPAQPKSLKRKNEGKERKGNAKISKITDEDG